MAQGMTEMHRPWPTLKAAASEQGAEQFVQLCPKGAVDHVQAVPAASQQVIFPQSAENSSHKRDATQVLQNEQPCLNAFAQANSPQQYPGVMRQLPNALWISESLISVRPNDHSMVTIPVDTASW